MPLDRGAGRVAVLVPAAGQGTRMGGERKQLRLLGGKPLVVQTLLVFDRHPSMDLLVVAAPAAELEALRARLGTAGLHKLHAVVAGGATRQESVAAALAAVPGDVDVVLVHDAVRPFVDPGDVTAVLAAVREHGAAALAIPVTDTLRRGRGDVFAGTVPRSGLFRMQTPQGCRRDWFDAAHAEAQRTGYQATDDVDLVQQLGHPVRIVPGSTRNIKITTPDDWELAGLLWHLGGGGERDASS